MRELKLKYFIELASNMGAKARSEAQAVEQSQKAMQGAINKTGTSLRALDSAYARFGANSSTERQIGYMRRLAQGVDQVTAKMRGLATLAAKGIQQAPAALAGVAAGVYAAKTMLDKPMDYGLRLARISNTTFNDRDAKGREKGNAELNEAIMSAVRKGGGTRDDAAAALGSLVASNAVTYEEAKKLLPTLTAGASGSGATALQLSGIAVTGKQGMNIPLADLPALLDEANIAGKKGGFELDNMSKHLPAALAMGQQSGLTGREGYRKIVAMMQASVRTAGTKDEAAINVNNLLGKVNSVDTAKDFAKQGFNLSDELVKGRAKGMDSVDTFVSLVDKIAGKDKEYTRLKKKLDGETTDGGKRETMGSMASILQGKAIGSVVQDKQALMALVAVMNNREYMAEIQQAMRDDKGSLGKDFEHISNQTKFKSDKVAAEVENAQFMALGGKAGVLNTLLDKSANLAQEFPRLTVAATGATMALVALGGAAGIFSLLAGRAAGGLPIPGVPGVPGAGKVPTVPTMNSAMALNDAPIAAGSVLGASAVIGGLAVGGAAMTYGAASLLRNNQAARDAMSADYAGDGAFAAAILNAADPINKPENHRGKGYNDPRLLTLTAPSIAEQTAAWTQPAKVELGEGKLAIDVRVTDDRASASTRLVAPMSSVKVSAGATNPGGVQ